MARLSAEMHCVMIPHLMRLVAAKQASVSFSRR
jgi:hypothetical protein